MPAPLLVMTACFFWAVSFIATKHALSIVPPLTVVALRLLVSSGCFLAWFALTRPRLARHGRGQWKHFFVLSLFGATLHYGSQTIGIGFTTASNASLYAVTGPIFIAIIAAAFLGERISTRKAVGILTALLGVLTVLGWDTLRAVSFESHLLGDLLVMSSIFMWAVFTVMSKEKTGSIPAFQLTAVITFIATACMVPVGWLEIHVYRFDLSEITWSAWAAIIFLGVTCSFLATLLYIMALERSQSQKVGVYLYTVPPMTYAIAALTLGEIIGPNLLIGSVLVFIGVYLTEKG